MLVLCSNIFATYKQVHNMLLWFAVYTVVHNSACQSMWIRVLTELACSLPIKTRNDSAFGSVLRWHLWEVAFQRLS